jgi:hypothetical protein
MGLFFPIIGGMFAIAIIAIFAFTLVVIISGFLSGLTAYSITKDVERFKQVWLLVTAILTVIGLIWFISIF